MSNSIPIKIKYHEDKYGELPRLQKLEIGNWVDVYAAKSLVVPGIDTTIQGTKELLEEINFYEKVKYSDIPLCEKNGLRYIENMKEYFLSQVKEIEKPILIPLGFSLELPEGYEGYLLPRSSSFKYFNFMQTNSMGIIDQAYCGDKDEWFYPVIGIHRDTLINKGDKVAQFRIQKSMENVTFIECETLSGPNRGGHGSTGKN